MKNYWLKRRDTRLNLVTWGVKVADPQLRIALLNDLRVGVFLCKALPMRATHVGAGRYAVEFPGDKVGDLRAYLITVGWIFGIHDVDGFQWIGR